MESKAAFNSIGDAMIHIALFGYAMITMFLLYQFNFVCSKYSVVDNGYKYIVRDNKGRFVLCTNNIWNVLSLALK